MNYLILSSPNMDRAWSLSAAMWELSSPADVQLAEGRQTTHWVAPIKHPTQNLVALPLPETDEYIHPSADMAKLAPFLNGILTANEQTATAQTVLERRGGRMNFSTVLTAAPSLQNKIKTQAEMEAAGWFPAEEI